MFKVGDIVETTAEAAATGMLDFKDGKGYEVLGSRETQVYICGEGSNSKAWYAASHFKLKEDTKVEKRECLFKEEQVVWDVLYGKGKVYDINLQDTYCVSVLFDNGVDDTFTLDGKHGEGYNRSLYFSEPKIEAATEPLFEPTFKSGDVVIISCFKDRSDTSRFKIGVVEDENEEFIYTEGNDPWDKGGRDFYRLGEKINFK